MVEMPPVRIFMTPGHLDAVTVVWADLTFIGMTKEGEIKEWDEFKHQTSLDSWIRNSRSVEVHWHTLSEKCREQILKEDSVPCTGA